MNEYLFYTTYAPCMVSIMRNDVRIPVGTCLVCITNSGSCTFSFSRYTVKRVWRYQRGNQNPYIKEEQTTQWPKDKVEKDKKRSTKHTHKTKNRVKRTPLKTGGELMCFGRVGSSIFVVWVQIRYSWKCKFVDHLL